MKKKLLIKALGYVLSAAMLFASVPMPVMAAEDGQPSVIDVTDVEEGDGIETVSGDSCETGETEYPLESKLDLLALDWKNESDETINHYLGMTEWSVIGMWLEMLSEEDRKELLLRNTILTQPTYVTEPDGAQYEILYHEYASKVYGEEKGVLYTSYPQKTSGYFTTKIVKLNGAGTAVNTATITHKVTGIDTSVATNTRQKVTVTKTIANNWCNIELGETEDTMYTYGSSESGVYPYVKTAFNYTKPAGYTVSTEYSSSSGVRLLYWNHSSVFGKGSMFDDDGFLNACRHEYPSSATCNNVSTANQLASTWTGKHTVVAVVNYLAHAGVGSTAAATLGNLVQTIYLTPVNYNVNYNGNGNTSGSTSAQNATYDQTYTTQQNGYSREYTVSYDGNGGTPAVDSQKASYTFMGWGLNQKNTVNYAAGQSYKNLVSSQNGTANMYAIWKSATVKLPTATRTGYQFGGWNIGAANASYTPIADVTAVAKWTANTYNIVLDKNDGSATETITATYDQSVELPTPARDGYTFTGWVGESGAYVGEVKNLTAENGATVNLKASWVARTDTPYTVYYFKQVKDLKDQDLKFVPFGEEGDSLPAFEVMYGTTDAIITVPAPNAEPNGDVEYITPEAQMVRITGDGSAVINFYYYIEQEDVISYCVEHYIKTSPDGKYELFSAEDLNIEDGTVVTPPLSSEAIAAVNAIKECYCKEPALQTVTAKDGMVIKYYYDCVKKESNDSGSISDDTINEIIKKLAAGLSFSMDIDGATYEIIQNPDGTLGIKFTSTNETKVVIPDVIQIGDKVYRVTEIYEKAFKDNTTIKEVVLSANISKIGDSAFEGCKNLEKVTLHDGLVTIGNKAFYNCTSLKSIKTPATLQTIGNYAFQNCTSLKTVSLNNGLVTIGAKAFYNCTALTKIKIPYTVIKIGSYAFAKCKKLKSLKFGAGSRLLSIGTGGFYGCTSLTTVKLPDKLTKVTKKTFYNCKKLKSVKIGAVATSIGTAAFKNCVALKTITGGEKVNIIYQNAFQNCKSLTKVTINARVQKIGEKAFYNCKKLKVVTVKSKALTYVGKNAFKKCKKNIRFKVPDSKIKDYSKLLKGKY